MTGASERAVEDRLIDLFQYLGIDRAHIAAGQLAATDWLGLATRYAERVASLSLGLAAPFTRTAHPAMSVFRAGGR